MIPKISKINMLFGNLYFDLLREAKSNCSLNAKSNSFSNSVRLFLMVMSTSVYHEFILMDFPNNLDIFLKSFYTFISISTA